MSKQQREDADRLWRGSTLGGSSPEEMRTSFAQVMAKFPIPEGVSTTETTLAGRRVLRIDADQDAGPGTGTILYFHGGAYVVGSPDTAASLTAHLVLRTGISASSLDYRLAPEDPFPAAIEDVTAAYRELLNSGVDPAAVVFAGDSAGGGLAVASLLAVRKLGLPMPAAVVAFSPGLDATLSGPSIQSKAAKDPVLTHEIVAATGAAYRAGAEPDQELLSPAVRGDLTGLPPLLLQVGSNEILLDDSVRMAARAAAADVDVILDVTADVPHVFQSFAGSLDEADHALDRAAAFIRQHVVGS
jgi:monoterpene epsilon-lactone hydrolase